MKKIFGFIGFVFVAIAFTSCTGGKGKPNFVCPEEFTSDNVTINFWSTMGKNLVPILEETITEFNEEYPNITVEHDEIGGYEDVRDNILTNIPVGSQPNLAYCYPDHVALYNKARAVVTLDPLIESEKFGYTKEQVDNFVKGYYDEGKEFGDGLMYTMPFLKSTEVMYYNETFFKEHNLTVPTTWTELWSVCEQIKKIDPTCIPLGIDSESNLFITLCKQYDSPYTTEKGQFKFDNKKNREFVEELKTNYEKGYFTTQTIYGSYTSGLFTATSGTRSYISIGSTGGATYQASEAFVTNVAQIPQVDPENAKVISQGPSICIFKDENPQEVLASWLFLKYLLSDTVQARFAITSGYVPVTKSAANLDAYKKYLDEADGTKDGITALTAKQAVAQQDNYYTSPAFDGSSVARDEVGNLVVLVIKGQKTVDKAFKDAIEECEYSQ